MQADRRHVLQGPAEPRRRQAEGAGLRHAQCLLRRERAHQHVADAVVERIAARQHGHRPAAMLLDFRQHVADRARPREPLTLDQRVRQGEMPLAAHDQLGVGHQPARDRREAVDAVLADADDGQPALRTATHGHAPARPDPRRHDGSLRARPTARRRSALRADPVARRPHRESASAADRHEDRRLRRHRRSRALPARRGDRGGDRCHASLCRPDVGARGRRLPRDRRAAGVARAARVAGRGRRPLAGRSEFRQRLPARSARRRGASS